LASTDCIVRYNRKIESVSEDRSIGPFAHLCIYLSLVSLIPYTIPHSCVLSFPTHYLILVSSLFLHIYLILVSSLFLPIYLILVSSLFLHIYLITVSSLFLHIYLILVYSLFLHIYLILVSSLFLPIYLILVSSLFLPIYLILVSSLFLPIYLSLVSLISYTFTSYLCPLFSFTLPLSCVLSFPTHYLIPVFFFSYTLPHFHCDVSTVTTFPFQHRTHLPYSISITHVYLIPSALHTHVYLISSALNTRTLFRQDCARLPYSFSTQLPYILYCPNLPYSYCTCIAPNTSITQVYGLPAAFLTFSF
jgi:hypothetical protein